MTRLKQEREQRGWSQAQVAEHIGTTRVNVTRWEQGLYRPSPFFRQALAALFGKTIAELGLLPPHDSPPDGSRTPSLAVPLSVSEIGLFRTLLAVHTAPLKRMPATPDFEAIKERHRDLSERLTILYQAHRDEPQYTYIVCEPQLEEGIEP